MSKCKISLRRSDSCPDSDRSSWSSYG